MPLRHAPGTHLAYGFLRSEAKARNCLEWRIRWSSPGIRRQVMGARVLVINDTQEILELFREILEEEGYDVVLYSYAIMDMDEIERINPDAIVLDYIFGGDKS